MQGNVSQCTLTPSSKGYKYDAVVKELQNKYGFKNLGEGGFGTVLGNENCAIKIVKDAGRCPEMHKEKEIYQSIQSKLPEDFKARVPHFSLYEELDTFCQFNMERIFSPLAGWGDIYDEDDQHGHGYVLSARQNTYMFNDINKGKIFEISKEKVYNIDRPGNLIHFYINHFDPNTKVKLDNNQGILLGKNYLEKYFTSPKIQEYSREIGKLLSFLIFKVGLIPTDIEVVLGTRSGDNLEVVPFIYDFNEASLLTNLNNKEGLIARAMYGKNGKFYFPSKGNVYYPFFREGFLMYGNETTLSEYNNLFNK